MDYRNKVLYSKLDRNRVGLDRVPNAVPATRHEVSDAFDKISRHINSTSNPHNVTLSQLGLVLSQKIEPTDKELLIPSTKAVYDFVSAYTNSIDDHKKNKNNPHQVKLSQLVGLDQELDAGRVLNGDKIKHTELFDDAHPKGTISEYLGDLNLRLTYAGVSHFDIDIVATGPFIVTDSGLARPVTVRVVTPSRPKNYISTNSVKINEVILSYKGRDHGSLITFNSIDDIDDFDEIRIVANVPDRVIPVLVKKFPVIDLRGTRIGNGLGLSIVTDSSYVFKQVFSDDHSKFLGFSIINHPNTSIVDSKGSVKSDLIAYLGCPAYNKLRKASDKSNTSILFSLPNAYYIFDSKETKLLDVIPFNPIVASDAPDPNTLAFRDKDGYLIAKEFFRTSDARYKRRVRSISTAELRSALSVETKKYLIAGSKSAGVVAQELPDDLSFLLSKDSQGFYSVNYLALLCMQVEGLKREINTLKNGKD